MVAPEKPSFNMNVMKASNGEVVDIANVGFVLEELAQMLKLADQLFGLPAALALPVLDQVLQMIAQLISVPASTVEVASG